MEAKLITYLLRIDDGEPVEFTTDESEYAVAVMRAFGILRLPYPCSIEIWVPDLLPNYGPYFYRIDDFSPRPDIVYGAPSVMHATKNQGGLRT